jgi:hypothetical protein
MVAWVAGWGLVLAARRLNLPEIPAVTIVDLDEAKLRSLRLALNRLGEDSGWDPAALTLEFADILEMDPTIDLQITGFETGEIDFSLDDAGIDEEDELPPKQSSRPVTQVGDLWIAGEHRIFCGDALKPESYGSVLGDDRADMVFADPPYNVAIEGNVGGHGSTKHDDFAMATGEMSPAEFAKILQDSFGLVAQHSIDGAIHFICMDWRHLEELMGATKTIYSELKNICVWNKSNAGLGSLYRSKHEFIFVFKNGKRPHINNIDLGRFGRSRSNVWDYAGHNGFNGTGGAKFEPIGATTRGLHCPQGRFTSAACPSPVCAWDQIFSGNAPRFLPRRFEPRPVCQPPAFSDAASRSMLARMSDQANSMVGAES